MPKQNKRCLTNPLAWTVICFLFMDYQNPAVLVVVHVFVELHRSAEIITLQYNGNKLNKEKLEVADEESNKSGMTSLS